MSNYAKDMVESVGGRSVINRALICCFIITRHDVAEAVLQTPLSLIDCENIFKILSLARDDILRECLPPTACHMSHIRCHISCVTCHVSPNYLF